MAIRDFFNKGTQKIIAGQTQEELLDLQGTEIESSEYATERGKQKEKFEPDVDLTKPASFARYGSAEEYYRNSFKRVYQQFPYDGSRAEITQFENESTFLDSYIFDKVYPRTNGFITLSKVSGMATSGKTDGYGAPSTQEYIKIVGGPHTSSAATTSDPLYKSFNDPTYRTTPNANIYDTDIYSTEGTLASGRVGSRASNLRTNPVDGVTIEFWLKKDQFQTGSTEKEVIFDLWNGQLSSSGQYGRLTLELTGATDGTEPFLLTLQSGTTGFYQQSIGASSVTSASVASDTWKHYAVSIESASSGVDTNFYVNGDLNNSTRLGSAGVNEITGNLQAYIGALQTSPSGSSAATGAGKLSGSLDDFRFWKVKRTSKDIGRNWFTNLAGGSNDHVANTELGIYYKFNEGITGYSSIDSIVLDYSGRISNGEWTGYSSGGRDTGSAMVLSTAATSEFKDPIIYSDHPTVVSELNRLATSGTVHDQTNNSMLYYSFPSFMIEEEEGASIKHLKVLAQIMGSYFDELHLQIEALPLITSHNYVSQSCKPQTLASRALNSKGFLTQEIFNDVGLLESIANRDEDRNFESDLNDVKNQIFQNIYNNLVYINKSKGTEKAFRNLIRCFGVDEDLVHMNLYPRNSTHLLRNNYQSKTVKKNYVNFHTENNTVASVYQVSSSDNSNTSDVTYISGSDKHLAMTAELEAFFPKKRDVTDGNDEWFQTPHVSCSIFGCHSAALDPSVYTWPAAASDYNFELYAVRPKLESDDAYFILKDRAGNFSLSTDLYGDVYDNKKWNFSVRIKNQNYPIGDLATGASIPSATIEFRGINAVSDVIIDQFSLSTAATSTYLTIPRRYYVGASLTNTTGNLEVHSDARVTSLRHWASYLDNDTLELHAKDPENYGHSNPERSSYLSQTSLTGTHVPGLETLALNWDFSTVTTSDASGEFTVEDFSSGSTDLRTRYPGTFGEIVGNQYAGRGINFAASSTSVVSAEYLAAAKQQLPGSIGGLDMISIPSDEEVVFAKDGRPDSYYFTFEKSMYQTISEQMINMFGTITEFNNLIGSPVHKYRHSYKGLDRLRNLFFERVQNTPDIDKYIEYYRWIDSSLSGMLKQLIPATADTSEGILNVIESHVLERNKYRFKAKIINDVDSEGFGGKGLPVGQLRGIEEMIYPWRRGHAPLGSDESNNCFWWKERALRSSNAVITSGDSDVDSDREELRQRTVHHVSSTVPYFVTPAGSAYEGSVYVRRSLPRIYNISITDSSPLQSRKVAFASHKKTYYRNIISFGSTSGLDITEVQSEKDCSDFTHTPTELIKKKKYFTTTGEYNHKHAPFVIHSSTVDTGYQSTLSSNFMSNVGIYCNHEDDMSITNETPLQGEYAKRFVGGSWHRHHDINRYDTSKAGTNSLDSNVDRTEAYDLDLSSGKITIRHQEINQPRSSFYREPMTKRPLSIQNIRHATGSDTKTISGILHASIGNFSKVYEVVQTHGRDINNRALVRAEGFSDTSVASSYISSQNDYAVPVRDKTEHVFVERFSAPGGPASSILDIESAQYSPYNDMNTRNWAVRKPLRELLTEKSERFGIRSGSTEVTANYDTNASFHKTNRNAILRREYSGVSDTVSEVYSYDNGYISHPIPRRSIQYSWVDSSVLSSHVYGHPSNFSSSDTGEVDASSVMTFVSQSDQAASGINVDFVGMNTLIYETIDKDAATIGYSLDSADTSYQNTSIGTIASPHILNALLLHRRGLYGYSSWSNLQNNSYNPLVRTWKKENTMAFNTEPGEERLLESAPPTTNILVKDRYSSLKTFTEPPVTSKNFPLRYVLDVNTEQGEKETHIKSVFVNETGYFTNPSLNTTLDLQQAESVAYNKIKNLYLGCDVAENSPISGFHSLTYKQTVYPRARNAYLAKTRSRSGYTNSFWRTSRADRDTLGDSKFSTNAALGGAFSSWDLDEGLTWSTDTSATSAGIMQNNLTFWHAKGDATPKTNLSATIRLNRVLTLEASAAVRSRTGMAIEATGGASSAATITHPLGKVAAGRGTAKWQVGEQAGYYDKDGNWTSAPSYPWDDSYSKFVDEMRAHNKDYSVVPEFIISDKIEDYVLNKDGNIFAHDPSLFTIKGASSDYPDNSSEDDFYKTYSTSDLFGEQLDKLIDDHKGFVDPIEIKLSVKAINKFVPYDGFYPNELLQNLYFKFSGAYGPHASFTGSQYDLQENAKIRPFIASLFAPGIWNNSFKAGLSVDYPVYTDSYSVMRPDRDTGGNKANYYLLSTGSGAENAESINLNFKRIPFEATVAPENYLSNIKLVDMEPHPSAALNVTGTWSGQGNSLYKMMAHNVLASTIDFFLPKGKLSELSTSPSDKWGPFVSGTTYGMRLKLRKSYNQARQQEQMFVNGYPTPEDSQLDVDAGLRETYSNSSAPWSWGPPMSGREGVYGTSPVGADAAANAGALDSLTGINPAYEPPMNNGESWTDFLYTHDSNTAPTLEELWSKGTFISTRFDYRSVSGSNGGSNDQPYGFGNINTFSMQLPNCINIYGKKRAAKEELDSAGNVISSTNDTSQKTDLWTFSPFWEGPMLNFSDVTADISTAASSSIPRGLYHQFGKIPTADKGVFLEVEPIPLSWLKNRVPFYSGDTAVTDANSNLGQPSNYSDYYTTYGGTNATSMESLVDKLGFKNTSVKLGRISNKKVISEAVVAIPYLIKNGKREFFEISKKAIATSVSLSEKGAEETNSIVDMVSKMKKYVFPPRFDFVRYPDEVTPFAMYIFEFEHEFDQVDLQYIWQGIQPLSAAKMKFSEDSISHPLLVSELMGKEQKKTGEKFPKGLRWMVFKAKQRAPTNYYDKTVKNQLTLSEPVPGQTSGDLDMPLDYGYNWPGDYCSIVEFVKMNAELKFAPSKTRRPGEDDIEKPVIRIAEEDCPEDKFASTVKQIIEETNQVSEDLKK